MSKTIYRLIDANFNRTQEGLRVIEDFLRFSGKDFSRIRDLRKKVATLKSSIPLIKELGINARESFLDEGRANQHTPYVGEKDLLSANFQRVKEGFRCLEEAARVIENIKVADVIQQLRFELYDIEKKFLSWNLPHLRRTALYVIFDVDMVVALNKDVETTLFELLRSGVDILQLRFSDNIPISSVLSLVERIKTYSNEFPFVINNRVDVADIVFSGVHVGQDDIPVDVIKKRFMVKFVGLSCHSKEQILSVQESNVDYFSIGPIFKTSTKPQYSPVGIKLVEEVCADVCRPFVLIGGINLERLPMLLKYKPWAICVCSDILKGLNIQEKVRKYMEVLERYEYDSDGVSKGK